MFKTKYKFIIFPILLVLVFGSFSAGKKFAQNTPKIKADESETPVDTVNPGIPENKPTTADIHLPFIKNEGQEPNKDVSFYTNVFTGKAWVLPSGIRYGFVSLPQENPDPEAKGLLFGAPYKDSSGTLKTNLTLPNKTAVIDEKFENGNADIAPEGQEELGANISSFIGNDKDKWTSGMKAYGKVDAGEVWPGVHVSYKAKSNNIEKIFTVSPQADPGQIKVKVSGGSLSINAGGELVMHTELGDIRLSKPRAFQTIDDSTQDIESSYHLDSDDTYSFSLGEYDHNKALIIDPLIAGTYLGGSNSEGANEIQRSSDGDIYVSGYTFDATFPTTVGAYDATFHGGVVDMIVARLSNDLSELKNATIIGGSGIDGTQSNIAFDSSGNVILAAASSSTDFPTTVGAYDSSQNGSNDIVVFKMNKQLTSLIASTFLGSAGSEATADVKLSNDGSVYVYGDSDGAMPATVGAYDTTANGANDLFIAKLNSGLTSLSALTFLGGTGEDHNYSGKSLVFDSSGNILITGGTSSADFPTTGGVYDTTQNGSYDIFISKLNPSLTSLLASTYLGGADDDDLQPFESIATASNGDIYIVSISRSANFPTTDGSTQGGGGDVAVAKFNSTLTTLLAATLYGKSSYDVGINAFISDDGYLYVGGYTYNSDFVTTPGAYQTVFGGSTADAILIKFSTNLSVLAATFFGTSTSFEAIYSVIDDGYGNLLAYCNCGSSQFSLPTFAYSGSPNAGSGDILIAKFSNLLAANQPPSISSFAATQQAVPGTNVTGTFDVTDTDHGKTSVTIQYSTDNTHWSTPTLLSSSVNQGSATLSGGVLSGIDTDTGTISGTFVWNTRADFPNVFNQTTYLRLTPNDGNSDGTPVTTTLRVSTNFGTVVPSQLLTAPVPPENGYKISINNSSVSTNDHIVEIQSTVGSDIKKMALSNTPGFEASSQEEFVQNKRWDLCTGRLVCDSGEYTVYAKFFTVGGQPSSVISNSIKLLRSSTSVATNFQNTADATSPSAIESRSLPGISFGDKIVRSTENPTVYFITKYGKKIPYPNMRSFRSYGYKSKDIILLSQDEINSFPDAQYIKLKNSNTIYEINNRAKKTELKKELLKTIRQEDVVQINSVHLQYFTINNNN